jgi:hypothetical protein
MIFLLCHTRKTVAAALFLLLLAAGVNGFKETVQIPIKGEFITSDELGNVFAVNGNQLVKFSSMGEKLNTYSNLYSGNISFVDTHDPFKILLFYESFAQVEFLDHTLSLSASRVDLNQLGLGLASLACTSYQGAFWVYNPVDFELLRINQQLEVSDRTGNLQQSTGYTMEPNYMIERDNFLYLNDPATGIHIFDKYGSYYKTIPVKDLEAFQVFNRKIIYRQGDAVSIYDTRLNEVSSTTLPRNDAISVSVCMSLNPAMLFMLLEEKLVFYEIR